MINAFDPRYVETYMPEFISSIKAEAAAKANADVSKATRESVASKGRALSTFPKTKRVSTERTEFLTYSRAGAPKK
jgi:hypothetical protein